MTAVKGYRIVPHTADLGLAIRGRTWPAFYRNAVAGLAHVHGLRARRGARQREAAVELAAGTPEELLVGWLNEVLYHVSAHGWCPASAAIRSADGASLRGRLRGPEIGSGCRVRTEVKAATYHGLRVARRRGHWSATVILDI